MHNLMPIYVIINSYVLQFIERFKDISRLFIKRFSTGPCSAVSNMSGCRSRGREFDLGTVPYFRGG